MPPPGAPAPGRRARSGPERARIERAKGVLAKRLGLSEAGAHRLLQTLAMNRRLPIAAVADALLGVAPAGRLSRARRGDARPGPRGHPA